MEVKRVKHQDIDFEKWDKTMAEVKGNTLFQYSWYLNAVLPGWDALINDDYSVLFPLPICRKKGVDHLVQPPFTRFFEFIGGDLTEASFWELLKKHARYIQFRSEQDVPIHTPVQMVHQSLELKLNEKPKYSTNAKRLIKKSANQFKYVVGDDVARFIALVKTELAPKISDFTSENIQKLEQLMLGAMVANRGELIEIYCEDDFVGGGFFFKDKSRITYLKGVSNQVAKKQGAMFGLINFAIEKYSANYTVFDFGGSNVENVARFYKKFGAEDHVYYNYEINNLPGWYKLAKQVLKRKKDK